MMMDILELKDSVSIEEDVYGKVRKVGVRGIDLERVKELGFFTRISNLLCAMHASVVAAYRIYSHVDFLMSELGGRRNEISKAMNDYEKAFSRFVSFWTTYYSDKGSAIEMNHDTEVLYHDIMKWAQLPETWDLGDAQRLEDEPNVSIKVDHNGRILCFHTTPIEEETIGDVKESWCVTKYDERYEKQTTVETDIDKASAIMVAKRLSCEDKDNMYTASMLMEKTEKTVTAVPFKVFKANETVGTVNKSIRR